MCGIAGVAWPAGHQPIERSVLEQMVRTLHHRGPDAQGFYLDDEAIQEGCSRRAGAALGHARLSIIDIDGGTQPVANEDESVWCVFNGEIYNYRELRTQLISSGHIFRSDSDTEVLVHLYEQFGTDCVQHLRGMFAFAIWDRRAEKLMLVRDRMGQKPVIYTFVEDRFAFASELKALLQIPGVQRQVDPDAVDSYLSYQYVPHPACILRGFHKLPPGHLAIYEAGKLAVSQYWHPGQSVGEQLLTDIDDARDRLRATLTESVRMRLRSDVPLGAFLSGGVDSTIISGLAQQESEQDLLTFSIGFPVKKFDEREFAQSASAHLKTRHHEQVVEPQSLSVLPRLIWHYDEPFADSSAIPTMALSEMTRQHVTVSLSGDGGDELFCGYERYQAVRIAQSIDRLPAPVRRILGAQIWQKLPASVEQKSLMRRGKRLLEAIGATPERRYLRWIQILSSDIRESFYQPEFVESLNGFDSAEFIVDAYRKTRDVDDFIAKTCHVDMQTYLPCDILTKVDIASMAHSLECRSPFLDHEVVDLAVSMPREWKLSGKQGKKILVDSFSDLIPPEIQSRKKMGFGVPLDHWFRDELRELVHDTLTDSRTASRGYFRPEAIRQMLDEHQNQIYDHSARLWALLCLELWHRVFVDGEVPTHCPTGF